MGNSKYSLGKEFLKEFLPSFIGSGASLAGSEYIKYRGDKTIANPVIRDNTVGALQALSALLLGNASRKTINTTAKAVAYKVPQNKQSEVTLRNILDQKNKADVVKSLTKAGMTAGTGAFIASGVASNLNNHLERFDSGDEEKGILGKEYFTNDYKVVSKNWASLKKSYDKDSLMGGMADPRSNPSLAWHNRRDINGEPDYRKGITDYEKLAYQIGNYFADDNKHDFDPNEKNFHLNMKTFTRNDRLNLVKMLEGMDNQEAVNFYNKARDNGLFDKNSLKAIDKYFQKTGKYYIQDLGDSK